MQPPELSHETVCAALIEYMKSSLLLEDLALSENSELRSLGIDSFGLIELTLFLERTYKRPFPLKALSAESARTIGSLSLCFANLQTHT